MEGYILAAQKILREELSGTVKVMFQQQKKDYP